MPTNGGTGYAKPVGDTKFPVIFVDIDRVSKVHHAATAAAQEHEMGHAFGLRHVCQPAAAPHTSIMATSNTMKPAWFGLAVPEAESEFECDVAGGADGDRSMGFSDWTISIATGGGALATVDQMTIIKRNIAMVKRALGRGVVNPPGTPRF